MALSPALTPPGCRTLVVLVAIILAVQATRATAAEITLVCTSGFAVCKGGKIVCNPGSIICRNGILTCGQKSEKGSCSMEGNITSPKPSVGPSSVSGVEGTGSTTKGEGEETPFGPHATKSEMSNVTLFEPSTTESEVSDETPFEPTTAESEVSDKTSFEPHTTESEVSEKTPFEPNATESEVSDETSLEPHATESEVSDKTPFEPTTAESEVSDKTSFEPHTTESEVSDKTSFEPHTTESEVPDKTPFEPTTAESEVSDKISFEPHATESEVSDKTPFEPTTAESEVSDKTSFEPNTTASEVSDKTSLEPYATESEVSDKSPFAPTTAESEVSDKTSLEPHATESEVSGETRFEPCTTESEVSGSEGPRSSTSGPSTSGVSGGIIVTSKPKDQDISDVIEMKFIRLFSLKMAAVGIKVQDVKVQYTDRRHPGAKITVLAFQGQFNGSHSEVFVAWHHLTSTKSEYIVQTRIVTVSTGELFTNIYVIDPTSTTGMTVPVRVKLGTGQFLTTTTLKKGSGMGSGVSLKAEKLVIEDVQVLEHPRQVVRKLGLQRLNSLVKKVVNSHMLEKSLAFVMRKEWKSTYVPLPRARLPTYSYKK